MNPRTVPALTQSAATDLFRAPPDQLIDVGGGGAVAYRCVGTGPDVLFVHGWPVSGATFRKLLPHLATHVTCHLLDLVGAGHSRFDRTTPIDIDYHIHSIRRVVDALDLRQLAAVGHDSGGMFARYALAGDPRLRAMALVNTEQPQGINFRLRQFLMTAKLPGFEHALSWAAMRPRLRRNPLLLGSCFADQRLLDGEFEELFLAPLRDDLDRRWAAGKLGRSFDDGYVAGLGDVHARIDVPVQLVWGDRDPFFPIEWAREMADGFADGRLHVVEGARLFVHEERPQEVAEAMLPTLAGTR